ncbi:MAG: hypothetical protein ACYCXU_08565 [Thermoleophilia bacterium]
MNHQDKKDRQDLPEPRASSGKGSPQRAQSTAARVLIILSIVAVFIVAGALVLIAHAAGGDQPAPQVTATQSANP